MDRSRPKYRSGRRNDALVTVFFVLVSLASLTTFSVARAAEEPVALQLEVLLRGQSTNLVASFMQLPDGTFAATRAELKELGIVAPGEGEPDALLRLDEIPNVTYQYIADTQSIDIAIPDSQRIAGKLDAAGAADAVVVAEPGLGTVFNYSLFAAGGTSSGDEVVTLDVASALVDARIYGSFGVLSSSQIAQSDLEEPAEFIRLDTTWSYSDPDRLLTYRAGDVISGGLSWTRPIRMGGVQVARNFALRPDLVTMPLPSMSGTAAVPSTVEVYINNTRTYTQDVPAGPFEISNIPVVSGSGTARLVVRDATGRETVTTAPFFASPELLRKGIFDFSAEAGLARTISTDGLGEYSDAPVASFSARYGWTDAVTLEGHVEGGAGLLNAGAGATMQIGDWAIGSLAGSLSTAPDETGGQVYASVETTLLGTTLFASTLRTFGDYNDLGSVTGEITAHGSGSTGILGHVRSDKPPRAVDQISLGLPLFGASNPISISFANIEYADEDAIQVVSASYSRRITDNVSGFVTGLSRFGEDDGFGIHGGVSWSIGEHGTLSSGITHNRDGTGYTAQYVKPMGSAPGSFGWQAQVTEGETSSQHAQLTYRGTVAKAVAGAIRVNESVEAFAGVEGALVWAEGGVFLAHRIDDAFAVVDTGVPGVDVLFENRPVGKTDASGRALVAGLRSYQRNSIAIDPIDLPLDVVIPQTQVDAIPQALSGVRVTFDKVSQKDAAVLVLRDGAGAYLPVGRHGKVDETGEAFVIGYDGQAYVTGVAATNSVTVTLVEGECHGTFSYAAEAGAQVTIDPVVCQ